MSFALGAILYFTRRDDAKAVDVKLGAVATAGWAINLLAEGTLFPEGYALYGGFYVNTVFIEITGYLVPILVLMLRPQGLFGRRAVVRV